MHKSFQDRVQRTRHGVVTGVQILEAPASGRQGAGSC
jgi:hypothetical protein